MTETIASGLGVDLRLNFVRRQRPVISVDSAISRVVFRQNKRELNTPLELSTEWSQKSEKSTCQDEVSALCWFWIRSSHKNTE